MANFRGNVSVHEGTVYQSTRRIIATKGASEAEQVVVMLEAVRADDKLLVSRLVEKVTDMCQRAQEIAVNRYPDIVAASAYLLMEHFSHNPACIHLTYRINPEAAKRDLVSSQKKILEQEDRRVRDLIKAEGWAR